MIFGERHLVGFYKVHTFEYEKVSFIALVFYWNSGFICTIAQHYSKADYLGPGTYSTFIGVPQKSARSIAVDSGYPSQNGGSALDRE
jgi:hypothetical protein